MNTQTSKPRFLAGNVAKLGRGGGGQDALFKASSLLLLILSVLLSVLILSCDPDEKEKASTTNTQDQNDNDNQSNEPVAVPIASLGTIGTTASKDASNTGWVFQGKKITFSATAKDEDKQGISQEDIAKVEFKWEWRKRGKKTKSNFGRIWTEIPGQTTATATLTIDAKERVGAYELRVSAKSGDNQADNHAKPYKFTVRKEGCPAPSTSTADKPDTVAKLRSRAKRLKGDDLQAIDTSLMKDMEQLFVGNPNAIDKAINCWDVSNVTNMAGMFSNAKFNQDIGDWDVSKVTSMNTMFYEALKFNNGGSASIGKWDTSSVINMNSMFDQAAAFNQDLSGWNVLSVKDKAAFANGTTDWKEAKPSWP